MAISRKDCKLVRVIINRAHLGPAWFNDAPSTPELRAVVAELRNQTREWLAANIVRELQYMMPPDERVKFSADKAASLLQAPLHTSAAVIAAHVGQALADHPATQSMLDRVTAQGASASARCSESESAPLPAPWAPLCSRCNKPQAPPYTDSIGYTYCVCP